MNEPQIEPGWYPTASGGHERLHDGHSWTDHVRPLSRPAATPVAADPPQAPAEAGLQPCVAAPTNVTTHPVEDLPASLLTQRATEDEEDDEPGDARRHGVLAALGALIVILAFTGSYLLLTRGADSPPAAPSIRYQDTRSPISNNDAEQLEIQASQGATQHPERYAVIKGDGVYEVGTDISPGTTLVASGPNCVWSRLKSTRAEVDDIIASGHSARPVITIGKHDGAFQSFACGFWVPVDKYEPPVDWKKDVADHDATYLVGADLTPGTYTSDFTPASGATCTWSTLSGFTGARGDVIASGRGKANLEVTLGATVKGFQTAGCGTWTKTGRPGA